MSLDSLQPCTRKCVTAAAESIGCSLDDIDCICYDDIPADTGAELFSCFLGTCSDEAAGGAIEFIELCGGLSASPDADSSADISFPSTSSSAETTTDPTSTSSTPPSNVPDDQDRDTSSNESQLDSDTLSAGAAAGIGIGAAVAMILLAVGVFLVWRRRRRPRPRELPVDSNNYHQEADLSELSARPKATPELSGKSITELDVVREPPMYEMPATPLPHKPVYPSRS